MTTTGSSSSIAIWLDNVQTQAQEQFNNQPLLLLVETYPIDDDKENLQLPKGGKKRLMETDHEQTPRPSKRKRTFDNPSQFPPLSSAKSVSSESVSEDFDVESHKSGRLSPVKQIQLLEDFQDYPVVFCNFDGDTDTNEVEAEDVTSMRTAIQHFADGIGILAYDNIHLVVSELPQMDKIRFQYSWANDLHQRSTFGSMPSTTQMLEIVERAREYDRGSGVSEDEWNSEVQHPLLKLALASCKHAKNLEICNVKTAKIEPPSLSRAPLPGRVVDFVVALKPDKIIDQAWQQLHPLPGVSIKSWNHTTRARRYPIAIHIETKGPMKSWTDGKPQIAIWVDAWLKRLTLISGNTIDSWPAFPLLIAQGHDWHLLIASKNNENMTIWEQITIGSTRSCFDAMKIIAILHWLMNWAETVWRPWFIRLINQ